jgi:hypothetical protein
MNSHKFTPQCRDQFLETLAQTCNITESAHAVGVTRQTAYHRRRADAAFRQGWDQAIDSAVDALEAEARRRAIDGIEEPHFYRGEICGTVRKYSDQLLMFLLKAHRPEKFRDRAPALPPAAGPTEAESEGAKERLESKLARLAQGEPEATAGAPAGETDAENGKSSGS